MSARFRNINHATVGGLRDVLRRGQVLTIRGDEVRELRNRVTVLHAPLERCVILPCRSNSIIASTMETIWVLAGRQDIGWLREYLPRAADFSDDGTTWRAAYGPRLRNWNGIDQLGEVRKLLCSDPLTRRAVMSLYDPACDFVDSKDIPCNNWLHWMMRDGKLHLTIGVRSNDVLWGFSGINAFEFSVLHEAMAHWTGNVVGDVTYLASSFHVYRRHYERAARIVDAFRNVTCYDFGVLPAAFRVPWSCLDQTLERWFAREARVRNDPDTPLRSTDLTGDPLLDGTLQLCRIHHGRKSGWDCHRMHDELGALPETDLTAAMYEYLSRQYGDLLTAIPHPHIAAFFDAYASTSRLNDKGGGIALLPGYVKALHRSKDAAYGPSWKKRGELTSILANVARKVDRLSMYASSGSELDDESAFDTAVDLLVYVMKYRLYLMERLPAVASRTLPDAAPPLSDHCANFDRLIDQEQFAATRSLPITEGVPVLERLLDELHSMASMAASPVQERLGVLERLRETAIGVICGIVESDARAGAEMRRTLHVQSSNGVVQ